MIDEFNKQYKIDNIKYINYKTTDDVIIEKYIKTASIIYTHTHLIDTFFSQIFPKLTKSIKLITHNSDHHITDKYIVYLNNDIIIQWFSQNIQIRHPKLYALPIGIANSMWKHGNITYLANKTSDLPSKNNDIYVNFKINTNTEYRTDVANILKKNKLYNVKKKNKLSFENYIDELATYKMSISPRGNGIDCHRIWECLYLGVVPIVITNIAFSQFEDLPIMFISKWDDISKAQLLSKYKSFSNKIKSFNDEKLKMSYWKYVILDIYDS